MLRRKEFVLGQNRCVNHEKPGKIVVKMLEFACSENLFQKFHLDSMTPPVDHLCRGRPLCSCDAISDPRTASRTPTTPLSKAFAPRPDRDNVSSLTWESSITTRNFAGNAPSSSTTSRATIVSSVCFPTTTALLRPTTRTLSGST